MLEKIKSMTFFTQNFVNFIKLQLKLQFGKF